MLTRSGLIVESREAGRTDDMAEDNRSTEARWGTPAHTTSSSTVASHRQLSLSPRSAGNGQQQQQYAAQQLSQSADDVSSNHSPYVATPPNHFSVSPLGDHPQPQDYFNNPTTQPYFPPTTGAYQPPYSSPYHPPSYPPPLQLSQQHQYYTSPTQEPESIRRYSVGTRDGPWSPAAGSPSSGQTDRKRTFPEFQEFGEVTRDRQYPDKMEEELERELERTKEGKAEGERDKKRKKTRGRRSRPRGRGD